MAYFLVRLRVNKRLWSHISAQRKRQAIFVFVMMVFASIAEMISLGALIPFLAILTDPERLFSKPIVVAFMEICYISERDSVLLAFTLFFITAALIAGLMRSILSWCSMRLAYGCGADLSLNIYRRTLYQPYQVHVSRNSSEVINGIVTKVNGVINGNLLPLLTLASSAVMMLAILSTLIIIDPKITLIALMGFSFVYGLIIVLTRRAKYNNGLRISRGSTQLIKALQEGLGGIRDILLDGTQPSYCDAYRRVDADLRSAQGMNQFLAQSPRFVVEALGMALIALLAYHMVGRGKDVSTIIPVLGALAIGAQRMLPIMQQSYAAWSSMQGGSAVLNDTLRLLEQPLPSYTNSTATPVGEFKKIIRISDLSFKYGPNGPLILESIDFCIRKGERIGLIGATGSGKSTLIDLIMGLLTPEAGSIVVDGKVIDSQSLRGWQNQIAHVPQSIFLSDGTIEQNIAFGKRPDEIDRDRVIEAAKKAQIAEFIGQLPEAYQTTVGERGVRLSGGQRQRLGIARALYKRATVIILDEATSALDNETEGAVMNAIQDLDKELTIIIIAHRLSTLKQCDRIIELEKGKIVSIGNYKTVVQECA